MKTYFSIGNWFRLRLSRSGIAPWGYEALGIAGLSMFARSSNGSLMLASYQPCNETWHWAVFLAKSETNRGWIRRAKMRTGQWHDYYRLPFGREIMVSRQDWHKRPVKAP